ncbi:MAG: hypothetical protein ACP5OV_00915 [Acidimicrobiales bacterium]
MDLALAASALRANATDVQVLLRALVDGLADALGERLQTTVTGGHLRKSSDYRSVRIAVGDEHFEALVDGASLRCVIAHLSGGIRIRSETLAPDEWIDRLVASLGSEATRSDSARRALEQLVIGGSQ